MQFEEIREKLLGLEVASLCDADKQLRVMDPSIRPLRTGLKLIGKAFTLICLHDHLTIMKALQDALPGDVLVIDTRNSNRAVAGELFATEALNKKLAGIVVDGGVRDTATLKTLPLPVYARFSLPMSGTTQTVFPTQIPVQCGGVPVNPGDVIFGDDDGIIAASLAELERILPIAETIRATEAAALAQMHKGASLLSLVNFKEHYEACKEGRESRLKFLA